MGQETIGLDTSIFIYSFEEHPAFVERAEQLFRLIKEGRYHAVFSCVGMIELLTGPKKLGREDIVHRYKELLASFPNLTIAWIDESIIDRAATLRASYGLKTPDAIHLATAIDFGASAFYTNDASLKKVKEIRVRTL